MTQQVARAVEKFERRYRLTTRLELYITDKAGEQAGLILCRYPLYVSRTSPQIIGLLKKCDGRHSVSEIARELGKKPGALLPALEGLQARGLLQLDQVELALEADQEAVERDNWPSVSFVIPVHNRPVLLRRCLQSIIDQNYPPEKIEIIVVDDSTDETPEVAASFGVKLLHNPTKMGAGPSRNQGAEAASHDLLALIDSDCVLDRDWLRCLVPCFDNPKQVAAGGVIRAANTASLIGRYEDVKSSLFTGAKALEVTPDGEVQQLSAANLLVRRSAFRASGGHDPSLTFGDDVDLCWRLQQQGRVSYRPVTGVRHAYRISLKGFLKTRFDYATGEAPLQLRYPDKRRVLALPGWYTPGLLGLLLWLSKPTTRWPLLLSGLPLLWKARRKWNELKVYDVPLTPFDVLAAEGRSFLAAGYHLGQHIGRYYSLPLLVLALSKPRRTALPVALALLGPTWGDYLRCKPRLKFPVFAALSLMENMAYQIGLVEGCRKAGSLRALVPEVKVQK